MLRRAIVVAALVALLHGGGALASPESDMELASAEFQSLSGGLPRYAPALHPVIKEVPTDETVPADLKEEAERWRTSSQLARLSGSAAQGTFEFAVIGDAEPGRFIWERGLWGKKGVFRRQIKDIAAEPVAFVLQLGDMVSRGIPGNYRLFYNDLDSAGLSVPYFTTVGNHDRHWPHGKTDDALYEDLFGKEDYYFDKGGWRFVSLDSSEETLTAAQLDWLDQVLDTPEHKVVFTHMPPKSMTAWTLGMTGISQGADRYLDILSRRQVDRVYTGHIHGYGIARYHGVEFVLSGCGGSPLYPMPVQRFYHYILVSAGPEGLSETVHPLKGAPFKIDWPKSGDFVRLESQVPPETPADDW